MQSVSANPLSRANIRDMTLLLRKEIKLENQRYFPVVEFLELVLPKLMPDFTFLIGTKQEMGNRHGLSCPQEKYIKIREDVYDGAIDGNGRDRFTCAHEIGHFFLHDSSSVQLTRIGTGSKLKPYLDPEWQANAFAGELLMPANLIKNLSLYEVIKYCNVSEQAAKIQINTLK
jgi:Zn-dependent peptidase ImmA (M78 family)